MADTIPSDSSIETVWPHLVEARAYVAGVLHKLRVCARLHGNAHVKIGITGTGQYPAFRIFYVDGGGKEMHEGAFYDSGAPMHDADPDSPNWSTISMSYQEVDAFLRGKSGFKGNAPTPPFS